MRFDENRGAEMLTMKPAASRPPGLTPCWRHWGTASPTRAVSGHPRRYFSMVPALSLSGSLRCRP